MRRIYLASSWRNERQPEVLEALREAGHLVYDFRNPGDNVPGFAWSDISPTWQLWTPQEQIAAYEHPLAREGLRRDLDAMKWSDTFVMLQPCGRSAALELGWAIGSNRLTAVLLAPGQEPELMIRLATMLTDDLDKLIEWLDA